MDSYEDLILVWQEDESDYDECTDCKYKGNKCHNQCMKIEYVACNPVIQAYLNKRR